jgi:4-aminobutyrate aminotransferase-like enzyme
MADTTGDLTCAGVLGSGPVGAMRRARDFLLERSVDDLLRLVGTRVDGLALQDPPADKRAFPISYGGGKPCDEDLLAAQGMFYVTESGRVMLDCTSGHYQMTWGYNHPELLAAARDAADLGIVWDNHSNIPGLPVKLLADRLTALGADAGLDRVLLGICTGSVACSTALKIMLARYRADPERMRLGPPVMIALSGNYHGTDVAAQALRGMWPGLVTGMEAVQVEPNDPEGLENTFGKYGRRVAGFWFEPILMNREAVVVDPEFVRLARRLCTEHGALMAVDEIQTGFWCPEVLAFRAMDAEPDFVIIGKGMTAGFHPLAGLLYRHEMDILEQYDAISTNGNASLAAFIALCSLRMIERDRDRLTRLAGIHFRGLCELADEFPDVIDRPNGSGFLSGIRFRSREDALGFHRSALDRGLWLRAHAYHPGHATVLMKYPLVVTNSVISFVLGRLRELLHSKPWR